MYLRYRPNHKYPESLCTCLRSDRIDCRVTDAIGTAFHVLIDDHTIDSNAMYANNSHTLLFPHVKIPYAAVLGFFVPYFDLDVMRLPTPPCASLVFYHSVTMQNIPNPALPVPNGISHPDNPVRVHL